MALPWLGRNRPVEPVDFRAIFLSAGSVLAVLAGFGAIVVAAASDQIRLAAMMAGSIVILVTAIASGNMRLFALWAIMLLMPFELSSHFGPISDKGGGERSYRIEVYEPFLFVLAAFQARDIWTGRWQGWRIPKVSWLWVLVIGFGVATIVVGPRRTTAMHETLRMVKVLLLFIVIANELRTPGRLMHCVAALIIGMFVQAAFGAAQFIHGESFRLTMLGEAGPKTLKVLADTSLRGGRVFRISAFLLHPNLFGIYLAALLPLAVGAILLRIQPRLKVVLLVIVAFGMAALIGTQSRSGWVSFAAAFTLLFAVMIFHRGLQRRSLLAAAAAAAALSVVVVAAWGPITTRLFESKDDATIGRAVFEDDARRMIAERPILGYGINSYVHEVVPFLSHPAKDYGGWIPPVHNIYLLWWAETGIVGLTIHLLLWGCIAWVAMFNLSVHDETLFLVNLACLAGLLAFAVDGFFSFTLRVNQTARVYWILAAIIMAVHYMRLENSAWSRARSRVSAPDGGIGFDGKAGAVG